MGRRGRHPDPQSKRSRAALAQAEALAKMGHAPGRATRAGVEPVHPPASVAARPAASAFWFGHAATLIEDGRLRQDQAETFGILCHLHADALELADQLRAEGWITATDKGQAASPIARLLRDARRDFVSLARDFGLTAAAAARLPQEQNDATEEDDEAKLLRAFTPQAGLQG